MSGAPKGAMGSPFGSGAFAEQLAGAGFGTVGTDQELIKAFTPDETKRLLGSLTLIGAEVINRDEHVIIVTQGGMKLRITKAG